MSTTIWHFNHNRYTYNNILLIILQHWKWAKALHNPSSELTLHILYVLRILFSRRNIVIESLKLKRFPFWEKSPNKRCLDLLKIHFYIENSRNVHCIHCTLPNNQTALNGIHAHIFLSFGSSFLAFIMFNGLNFCFWCLVFGFWNERLHNRYFVSTRFLLSLFPFSIRSMQSSVHVLK